MFNLGIIELFLLLVIGLLFVALIMLFFFVLKISQRFERLTSPVYDQILSKARSESERIINQAKTEAEESRMKSAEEASKYLATALGEINGVKDNFYREFNNLTSGYIELTKDSGEKINSLGETILKDFNGKLDQIAFDFSGNLVNIFSELKENFDKKLDESFSSFENVVGGEAGRLGLEINRELDKMRSEIHEYKTRKLEILDDNIVSIVERTTQIVLDKTLSAEDHQDIVRDALSQAKGSQIKS